ncbi:MAG: hypothetical protein JRF72_18075 [Deltaproteobacteria bacterium]|nr:hypothetical protein [Deltaproteobacteria bacterium]
MAIRIRFSGKCTQRGELNDAKKIGGQIIYAPAAATGKFRPEKLWFLGYL